MLQYVGLYVCAFVTVLAFEKNKLILQTCAIK